MRISRRRLLAGGIGAGAGLAVAGPARAYTSLLGLPGTQGDVAGVIDPVFSWGVASGDPTTTSVVLWTRVAERPGDQTVRWTITREDGSFVADGEATPDPDADRTIRVVVRDLPAGTRLHYRFEAHGRTVHGRTKTLPTDPRQLRIGVVSCSKFADGYYNSYRALAAMDVDVVLHLGDYIYASYSTNSPDPAGRWAPIQSRHHRPARETRSLADYHERYRQYRSDPDLQALHASVPVISVWDDNDIANNAWREGHAQVGQPDSSGDAWYARKAAGQAAWRHYHPVGDGVEIGVGPEGRDLAIWRRFQAGNLLDLCMLDTRLQRDQQVSNGAAASTDENDDPDRTMLGPEQLHWLRSALGEPSDAWRVLGQGIVMTHWRVVGYPDEVGRLAKNVDLVPGAETTANGGVYWNSDGWDGYTAERDALLRDFAASSGDVVVLTGDVHSSWANELVPEANYAHGSSGVEFVTPAASTRSFAQNVFGATAPFEAMFTASNPWIKQCDMDANGFMVLTLTEDRAISQWYAVDTQSVNSPTALPFMAWQTLRGTNSLVPYLGV